MKTPPIEQALAAALLLAALCFPLSAFSQGSLTPPGAPAATMRTLAQIEPRTPISSAPFTISVPGSYYLTTNITVSSGNAINVSANGVTLDLNGFTIASTAASATGNGIILNSVRNLTILNGFIQGGVANNGSGSYSGPGFQYGIYYSGAAPVNVRVAGVSVSGCLIYGIYLGKGDSTVVESCTVRTVGGYGIAASTLKNSVAVDCGSTAISGDQVTGSRGECTGGGYGLYASSAQNCYGSSTSSYGLYASAAQNCYGTSTSGTSGLYGTTAQNCYGHTESGIDGLAATTAQNCYGSTSTGTYGLYAYTAQNCYGYASGAGTGLRAAGVAIGCIGSSSSGVGLSAYIANSCQVPQGTTSVSYKYNMP